MKKRALKYVVITLGIAGILISFVPFVSSLFPGSNTDDPGFLVVSLDDLKVGEAKIYEYNKYPVLVLKSYSNTGMALSAYVALPNFSDPMIKGCGVRPINEFKNAKDINKFAFFYEPCRGVFYDQDGDVLVGSHPKAQRLNRLRLKASGSKAYIGKFT